MFMQQFVKSAHQGSEVSIRHVRDQIVVHTALAEQRTGTTLDRVRLEPAVQVHVFSITPTVSRASESNRLAWTSPSKAVSADR